MINQRTLPVAAATVLVLCCLCIPLRAQETAGQGFGIHAAYQYIFSSTSTSMWRYPDCCGEFAAGSIDGFTLTGLWRLPLAPAWALELGFGFSRMSGSTSDNGTGSTIVQGNPVPTAVEHRLDVGMSALRLQPMIAWRAAASPVQLFAAPVLEYQVSGSYTIAEEEWITPDLSLGGGSVSVTGDEVIFGLYAGAGYDIPLGEEWLLRPEAGYRYNFTDSDWKQNNIAAGVTLMYTIPSAPAAEVDLPPPPQPEQHEERPFLSAHITATGIDDYGNEEPFVRSRVEEYISTSMRPVLPFVFFEDGSAELPRRYITLTDADTGSFRVERMYGMTELQTYYHLLNIVARRMQQHPAATLTLTGCNTEHGREKGATDLSRDRAEAVRAYLADTWNIDPDRIRVKARDLPETFSQQNAPDGLAENRRVEFSSDDPSLLDPVVTRDTLRRVTPPMIRFRPDVSSDARVVSWELTALQSGKVLTTFTGKGSLPEFVDWDLHYDPSTIPRLETNLEYMVEIRDESDQRYVATGTPIPVDQITLRKKRRERSADKEIDRYRLILFGIGSAELKPEQVELIHRLRGEISLNSSVRITGHTDRIGDDESNRILSERRARAVADEIAATKMTVQGMGEQRLLHDNSLPEGRFYCRTVSITVETPVQY